MNRGKATCGDNVQPQKKYSVCDLSMFVTFILCKFQLNPFCGVEKACILVLSLGDSVQEIEDQ